MLLMPEHSKGDDTIEVVALHLGIRIYAVIVWVMPPIKQWQAQ